MKYIDNGNQRIAYHSKGRGKVVVLLHGFCEDSNIWEDFKVDLIEEKYRVVCIDLPGFGKSGVEAPCSIADMADAVAHVLDTLNITTCTLIGHSMGGYVALAFAEKYAHLLNGLGLFHSHPYADTAEKKVARQKSSEFVERQGHQLYVKQLIPKLFAPRFVRSNRFLIDKMIHAGSKLTPAGIINALHAMKDRPDRSSILTTIRVPVLFIIGDMDEAVPHAFSMEQTHLPEVASIHVLERVGHMGMFEAKKQTQLIVRKFVEYCLL
jgi:pimeloyl-ACP methyl ester carboxylesterase